MAASASRQVSSSPPRSRVFGQTPSCTPAITTVSNSRPSAPAGVRMRTVSSRSGRVEAVLGDIAVEDAAHERPRIGVERALDEALRRLEQRDDGVEVAVRLLGERTVPARELGPGRSRPLRSHAVHSSSCAVAPRCSSSRSAPSVRASARGATRLAGVDRSNSSGWRIAETSSSRPEARGARPSAAASSGAPRGAARSAAAAARSGRAARTCRASASGDVLERPLVARRQLDQPQQVARPARACRARRPGPLERAGTSRAASSASSAATWRVSWAMTAQSPHATPSCTCRSRSSRAMASNSSAGERSESARTEPSASAPERRRAMRDHADRADALRHAADEVGLRRRAAVRAGRAPTRSPRLAARRAKFSGVAPRNAPDPTSGSPNASTAMPRARARLEQLDARRA